MDEALQNVLDYIDTEGESLSRLEYRRMIAAIISDCESRLEADEEFGDSDEDDEE